MRLKFLFFPIILIISVSIFIGFIWPEFSDLKAINDEKAKSQADLKAVQDKQDAISKVGAQISSDSTSEAAIKNYLPNQRVEERILSGVNFLATDSGVSLVNVTLKDAADAPAQAAGTNLINNILTGGMGAANQATGAAPAATQAKATDGVQYTEANISVSGDYNKIRLFVDQLQRMPILNIMKSLTIKTVDTQSSSDKENQIPAGTLSAVAVVDFGYMGEAKVDNQKIANLNPKLDIASIKTLTQYVSQKAPSANSAGDSNGKTNPFLP